MTKHLPNTILLRHGESIANVNPENRKKFHPKNLPLSLLGYEQAVRSGMALRQFYNERSMQNKRILVLHSPYKRASDTAKGVIAGLDGLHAVRHVEPLLHELRGDNTTNPNIPESELPETLKDLKTRTHKFKLKLPKLLHKYKCDSAIIVGHGISLHYLEADLCNKNEQWLQERPYFNKGEARLIEYNEKQGSILPTRLFMTEPRSKSLPRDYKTEPYDLDNSHSR